MKLHYLNSRTLKIKAGASKQFNLEAVVDFIGQQNNPHKISSHKVSGEDCEYIITFDKDVYDNLFEEVSEDDNFIGEDIPQFDLAQGNDCHTKDVYVYCDNMGKRDRDVVFYIHFDMYPDKSWNYSNIEGTDKTMLFEFIGDLEDHCNQGKSVDDVISYINSLFSSDNYSVDILEDSDDIEYDIPEAFVMWDDDVHEDFTRFSSLKDLEKRYGDFSNSGELGSDDLLGMPDEDVFIYDEETQDTQKVKVDSVDPFNKNVVVKDPLTNESVGVVTETDTTKILPDI